MGLSDFVEEKDFTKDDILDRNLVLRMLEYEDSIIHSSLGDEIYKNPSNNAGTSLEVFYIIHRMTLAKFGFNTNDTNVNQYRNIFKTYYNSPTNYDKEVIGKVTYMRENKCIFYSEKVLNVGDKLPDCILYESNGVTLSSIYSKLGDTFKYGFVAGFSLS